MTARTRTAIVVCLVGTLGAALLAIGYTALVDGDLLFGAVTGAVVAAPIVAFETFLLGRFGAPIRHLSLWALTLVSFVVWMSSIAVGMLVIAPAIMGLDAYPEWYLRMGFRQDAVFALLVVVFVNIAIRVHSLIGTRMLVNFLLGRYHRPLREEQVFMFLDFLDARGMSRRLGDIRAQSLIAAVFFDIDEAVLEYDGETHRYLADELVVTWPLARGTKDARCLACALRIEALLSVNAGRYRERFGEAPRLRMGLHGGPVVVSEIGDERREIVYFGDTVNTAARLRGLAKRIDRSLVVSGELLERMALPSQARAEDMGAFELSGKAEPTRVFAVRAAG